MRLWLKSIYKVSLVAFGIVAVLWGLVVIAMAIATMFMPSSLEHDKVDKATIVSLYLLLLIMSDFIAFFGCACVLYGLRCSFGPVPWIVGAYRYFWENALRVFGIMVVFGMIVGLTIELLK